MGKKMTLNAVGKPSSDLQATYEAVMAFNYSGLGEIAISNDSLDQFAAQEATMAPLQGGCNGMTKGMERILRQATREPLETWSKLRSTFDAAIQPFMEKIEAAQHFEVRKTGIERDAQKKKDEASEDAQQERRYSDARGKKDKADQHYDELFQGEGGRPVNLFSHSWWYVLL